MALESDALSSTALAQFGKVDAYINSKLLAPDSALEATLQRNASSSLAAIDVAPNQGKLLYLLAKINNAKNILEVGTLGGYSALWFAKAVSPNGRVTSLEIDPTNANVAAGNIENAGYSSVVDIRVGPAADTLKSISESQDRPVFDFVFIDADKVNNLTYFKYALELSRIGTIIVVDNIARRGRLVDANSEDPSVIGTRDVFDYLETEEAAGRLRVESTAIQTVGSKGWDGFLIAVVVA